MLLFEYLKKMKHISRNLKLISGSVLLRPCRPSDAVQIYEAVRESISELSLWMPWCHVDYSLEEAKSWVKSRPKAWRNGLEYEFVIIDSNDGSYLGNCGLSRNSSEHPFANLGYWIRTSRTNQGIATKAVLSLARFGISDLELERVEITVAPGNKASQRVAEKVGAIREGVLRNRLVIRDGVCDALIFSLIPQDLNAQP